MGDKTLQVQPLVLHGLYSLSPIVFLTAESAVPSANKGQLFPENLPVNILRKAHAAKGIAQADHPAAGFGKADAICPRLCCPRALNTGISAQATGYFLHKFAKTILFRIDCQGKSQFPGKLHLVIRPAARMMFFTPAAFAHWATIRPMVPMP